MSSARRAVASSALVAATLLGTLTGCGQADSPAEEVPALATALDRVDAAVEAENYDKARSAVESLLAETRRARQDGSLSAEDAERIRTAARSVLASLPAEQVDPEPQQQATTEPEETPSGDEDEADEKSEQGEKGRGKPEKDDDKPGKGNDSEDD